MLTLFCGDKGDFVHDFLGNSCRAGHLPRGPLDIRSSGAGRKAKAATAYEAALQHVRHAQQLLGITPEAWIQQPQLALDIQLEEATCLSLTGELQSPAELLLTSEW